MRRHARALFAVSALLMVFGVSSAQASKGVVGFFGNASEESSSADGEFAVPRGVAVNTSGAGGVGAGSIYVADSFNDRIQRFSAAGVFQNKFGGTGTGAGQLSNPTGIAVDQGDGSIYVYERGNQRVSKFTATGTFLFAFGAGVADGTTDALQTCTATCFQGLSSTADGGFGAAGSNPSIAVAPPGAPNAGDVFVADPGEEANNRIQEFEAPSPSGPAVFVAKAGSHGSGDGQFGYASPTGLAVDDAGRVYAVDRSNNRVQRFGPALAFDTVFGTAALEGGNEPVDIAIDPGAVSAGDASDDHVFVVKPCDSTTCPSGSLPPPFSTGESRIKELEVDGTLLDTHLAGGGLSSTNALALNTADDRLYLSSVFPGQRIYILDTVVPATVVATPPTPITSRTATLHGSVNPNGAPDVSYRFEYSRDGIAWSPVSTTDTLVGSGTSAQSVSQLLDPQAGLEPNTLYHVRLAGTRPFNETAISPEVTFTTLTEKPQVETTGSLKRTATTVSFESRVDPRNSPTTYHFEYGTTDAYGQSTPSESAGTGSRAMIVRQTVSGLLPNTVYHYRIVADNAAPGAPSVGSDLTVRTRFTDAPIDPQWPTRGIEMVTPPEKGGQAPVTSGGPPQTNLNFSNGRALWTSISGIPGSSTGVLGSFVSERDLSTPTGWSTRSLVPPLDELLPGFGQYELAAASADFQTFLFHVGTGGLVKTDEPWVRMEPDGTQTVLAQFPKGKELQPGLPNVTTDLQHVVGYTETTLDPGDTNETYDYYDIGSGTPVLLSVLPNGEVAPCGAFPNPSAYSLISTDPDEDLRAYFESNGSNCEFEAARQLYVRNEATSTTTLVSGPPVSGPDMGGRFIRASADGKTVIYRSQSKLTADDTNTTNDLYRWRVGSGNDCLTCVVSNAAVDVEGGGAFTIETATVSPDLSYIYFTSANQLLGGEGRQMVNLGSSTPRNVYVWHDGEIDYVGERAVTSGNSFLPAITKLSPISRDGSVFIFASSASGQTPDSPGGIEQYYRYDHKDGSLTCLTCPPAGETALPINENEKTLITRPDWTRVSADGGTFVFQTPTRYLPEDINQSSDVYEWHDGRLRLVTDGETQWQAGAFGPNTIGISPDGTDIYFTIGAPITGFETDEAFAIYDARIGGGFTPPGPATHCVEDSCQGPLLGAPPAERSASAGFAGQGNSATPPRKRCGTRKVRRGKRCVSKRGAKQKQRRQRTHRNAGGPK